MRGVRPLGRAEMLADLVAYDAAKRDLASGEEELNPAAVVDRLLDRLGILF